MGVEGGSCSTRPTSTVCVTDSPVVEEDASEGDAVAVESVALVIEAAVSVTVDSCASASEATAASSTILSIIFAVVRLDIGGTEIGYGVHGRGKERGIWRRRGIKRIRKNRWYSNVQERRRLAFHSIVQLRVLDRRGRRAWKAQSVTLGVEGPSRRGSSVA